MAPPRSVHQSIRLSASTSGLLDAAAERTGESRDALVDRLLDAAAERTGESRDALVGRLLAEAVRCERHPLVQFRPGAAGGREPGLVGTRLLVRQVVATLREHGGDVPVTAGYFDVPERLVRPAVSYDADFGDEIDADAERAAGSEADERERLG